MASTIKVSVRSINFFSGRFLNKRLSIASFHVTPNNSFSPRVDTDTDTYRAVGLYILSIRVSVLFFLKYRFRIVFMLSILNLWVCRCRFSAGSGSEKDIWEAKTCNNVRTSVGRYL